jgi:4-carboxymuconolactone decarboxylase
MARLSAVTEKTSPETAAVFDEIRTSRGFVSNALSALGHAPEGLKHLARFGAYCKYQTDLPERQRELSYPVRGARCRLRVDPPRCARGAIRNSAAAVDDIGAGRTPSALPAAEQAIVRYIAEMFSPSSVSEAAFKELARHFTPRQITDISMSASYYRALGTMVMAFGVDLESPDVLQVEQDWQKKSLP